jgi:two-component system chemotaxis response regulator CheY
MSKKIIVVDDSSTIRQQVAEALSAAGFDVIQAGDGVEGIDRIDRHPDASMVLCDIHMPNMTGIEMLGHVKAGGKNAALPIVMLTTEGDPAVVKEAKSLGARGWIVKPFKRDMLLATVRKLTSAA